MALCLERLVGEEPAKKVKEEEPDELFKDEKGQEIRNFVLNIARER